MSLLVLSREKQTLGPPAPPSFSLWNPSLPASRLGTDRHGCVILASRRPLASPQALGATPTRASEDLGLLNPKMTPAVPSALTLSSLGLWLPSLSNPQTPSPCWTPGCHPDRPFPSSLGPLRSPPPADSYFSGHLRATRAGAQSPCLSCAYSLPSSQSRLRQPDHTGAPGLLPGLPGREH